MSLGELRKVSSNLQIYHALYAANLKGENFGGKFKQYHICSIKNASKIDW